MEINKILKLLIIIILLQFVQNLNAQDKKHIIDFEEHLSNEQVKKIEELIVEAGLNIDIVFFNVNNVLGFELKEARSVDEYIDLWKDNNKNWILILFSNVDVESDYWENNLKLVSTSSKVINKNIDKIITITYPILSKTRYIITDEKSKQQEIFYNAIAQLIGQIASDADKIIQILSVGNDKEKGFCAGIVVDKGAGINGSPETMDYSYFIDKSKADYAKLSIYTKQGELFFEQEIPVGQNNGSWDGHKTPVKNNEKQKYITYDESPFKIVITATKKKSSNLRYIATSEYTVHEQTPVWLEAYNMDEKHTITSNVELSTGMEKNRFRRFLALEPAYYREYLEYGLDLEQEKITALEYLKNNISVNTSFSGYQIPLHQGFDDLIKSISFKGKYKSVWSLSIRYIRGREKEKEGKLPKISEHGLGVAFDIESDKNGMIDSKIYFEYMRKLTWLDKWKEIPPPQALFDASNIFEKICEQRKTEKKMNVDQLLELLSKTAFKINGQSFKISEFIDACMSQNGTAQLYEKYQDLYIKAIPLNLKRRQSKILDKSDLDQEIKIRQEANIFIGKIQKYLDIADSYIILFFLDKRDLPVPNMNTTFYQFKDDLLPTVKYLYDMEESLQNLKAIINQQIDNRLNKPIPEISEFDIVRKLDLKIDNEFKERLIIFSNLENFDFAALGELLNANIGNNNSYIRKSFMYGFCNVEPVDAETWIRRSELQWGVYGTRLDCMHFELNPKYANEFYSIYNK